MLIIFNVNSLFSHFTDGRYKNDNCTLFQKSLTFKTFYSPNVTGVQASQNFSFFKKKGFIRKPIFSLYTMKILSETLCFL